MNDMPVFDVSSIPSEFNPLAQQTLGAGPAENIYAQDDKLYIQFKTEPVLNPYKSTQAGRPIYEDVDMVVIRAPGSRDSVVAPAKWYMDRFGDKYRLWKSSQMEAASGTPLENFPFLFTKPSMIAELKYRNIYTVEQLATLSDAGKQGIMGGHELSKKAADWIAKSAEDAIDTEKEEMRAKMAAMEEQLAALTARAAQSKPDTPKAVAVK